MNRAGIFRRISSEGFPWDWPSLVHTFCYSFLLYCMAPSGSGVEGTISPQAVAQPWCPSDCSFLWGQSRIQDAAVTSEGACGFVQDQQHVRGVHMAEIWLSEEAWRGMGQDCDHWCGAAARGLLACTGSAARKWTGSLQSIMSKFCFEGFFFSSLIFVHHSFFPLCLHAELSTGPEMDSFSPLFYIVLKLALWLAHLWLYTAQTFLSLLQLFCLLLTRPF